MGKRKPINIKIQNYKTWYLWLHVEGMPWRYHSTGCLTVMLISSHIYLMEETYRHMNFLSVLNDPSNFWYFQFLKFNIVFNTSCSTSSDQLMSDIWGSPISDNDVYCLLGCDTINLQIGTIQRNLLSSSSSYMFLWNSVAYLSEYAAWQPRRQ